MLDTFIIEEIQRRERERDARHQPRIEHPGRFPFQPPPQTPNMPEWRRDSRQDGNSSPDEDADENGVIILDM